jgi:hypothetical protein
MKKPAADNPESGRTRRYTGELASPIRIPAPPTFSGAVTAERLEKFHKQDAQYRKKAGALLKRQINQKLRALLKHHQIRGSDMQALFWALLSAHVPGFNIATAGEKRGRKRDWDGPRLVRLYLDVQAVKTPQRRTDRQAIKFLVENEPYCRDWGPRNGSRYDLSKRMETLESRLQDAKRYVRFVGSLAPGVLPDLARVKNNSGN